MLLPLLALKVKKEKKKKTGVVNLDYYSLFSFYLSISGGMEFPCIALIG